MTEITRRNVLLECLDTMRKKKAFYSVRREGRFPIEGQEKRFYDYEKRIGILEDLIQAYESEPVRRALANWQRELMAGKAPTTEDLKR